MTKAHNKMAKNENCKYKNKRQFTILIKTINNTSV